MPKEATNNRINYYSVYGRVSQLDNWLDQSVKTTASPTFSNLSITNDVSVNGNLYVYGNTSIFNTNISEFEDNLILINSQENNIGVSLGIAGFEVERGSLTNYQFIFQESNQTFRVGLADSTQSVATREDSPLSSGLMIWNSAENRIDSQNYAEIPFSFNSLLNSSNSSTFASLSVPNGGVYIGKDLNIAQKLQINQTHIFSDVSNNLNFNIPGDMNISAGNFNLQATFAITNSDNAINATTASFYTPGGIGVVKDIYQNGSHIIHTNSTSAILVRTNAGNNVFTVDTVNLKTNISSGVSIITNNTTGLNIKNASGDLLNLDNLNSNLRFYSTNNSTDISSGGAIFDCGMSIGKNLNVGGITKFNNTINANSNLITNVASPILSTDVANKGYVDAIAQGISVKDSVEVATTTTGNFSTDFDDGSILDGFTLQTGNRILIKNQTNGNLNGIYIVQSSGSPIRSLDFDIGYEAAGSFVFVKNGVLQQSLGFICNSASGSDIIDTNPISFTEFTGLGLVSAGDGLSKNLNELSVNVDNGSLEIVSDILRVKSSIAGTGLSGGSGTVLSTISDQSHVNKVGTLNTGTWQADIIEVAYGGSGRNFFTSGSILFGNDSSGILTSNALYFNSNLGNLGIGTTSPSYKIHVSNSFGSNILLNSDVLGTATTSSSSIIFASNSVNKSQISVIHTLNQIASGSIVGATLISSESSGSLQFSSNGIVKMTLASSGNISIGGGNTSPNFTLDINGSLGSGSVSSANVSANAVSSANLYIGNSNVFIENTMPIIGKNGTLTVNSRDLGLIFERYQKDNDLTEGDIITDTLIFSDILPSQTGVLSNQVKFSAFANTNVGFYNGYWIKEPSSGQVRQIISYSGGTRLATISPWTTPPIENDTIEFYNKSLVGINYNEINKEFSLINTPRTFNQTVGNDLISGYLGLKCNNLVILSNSTSGILSSGGIYITNTQNATSSTFGGSLTSLGGGSFNKILRIGESLGIGKGNWEPSESLHIRNTIGGMLLENSTTSGSNSGINYIRFSQLTSNNSWGILTNSASNGNYFSFTKSTNGGSSPTLNDGLLTFFSNGNLAIGNTQNSNSLISIKNSRFISTDSSSGFLGLTSDLYESTTQFSTSGSKILLYSNTNSGNIIVKTGSTGSTKFYSAETEIMTISPSNVQVFTNGDSINSSTGSVILNGGLSIKNSTNSVSGIEGGSFTCAGGGAFDGDLYVNGNLFLNGISSPTLTFNNTGNFSSMSYGNSKLQIISNEALLSFWLKVIPITSNIDNLLNFNIPEKINNIVDVYDLNSSINGFTNDSQLISIFNTICGGVSGTTTGIIKFQSNNNVSSHNFSILCRYEL